MKLEFSQSHRTYDSARAQHNLIRPHRQSLSVHLCVFMYAYMLCWT